MEVCSLNGQAAWSAFFRRPGTEMAAAMPCPALKGRFRRTGQHRTGRCCCHSCCSKRAEREGEREGDTGHRLGCCPGCEDGRDGWMETNERPNPGWIGTATAPGKSLAKLNEPDPQTPARPGSSSALLLLGIGRHDRVPTYRVRNSSTASCPCSWSCSLHLASCCSISEKREKKTQP